MVSNHDFDPLIVPELWNFVLSAADAKMLVVQTMHIKTDMASDTFDHGK